MSSLLQPGSAGCSPAWAGSRTPPFQRPGFPAMVLPRWCLGSTWSLCYSPWDTHCPSHVPKDLSLPLLPPSLPLRAVPFSWHSLPVTTAPVLSTPQSRPCLVALPLLRRGFAAPQRSTSPLSPPLWGPSRGLPGQSVGHTRAPWQGRRRQAAFGLAGPGGGRWDGWSAGWRGKGGGGM